MITMTKIENEDEYEEVLSSYYEGRGVSSLISINIDTKKSDKIANEISQFQNVEDVLLVTGEVDFVIKARFQNYDHMKKFLTKEISQLDGVDDVSSMMIVTTYKERGNLIEVDKEEE